VLNYAMLASVLAVRIAFGTAFFPPIADIGRPAEAPAPQYQTPDRPLALVILNLEDASCCFLRNSNDSKSGAAMIRAQRLD